MPLYNTNLKDSVGTQMFKSEKKHINIKKYPENPPVRSHPKNSLCGGSFPGRSRRSDPPHINLGSQIFMLATPLILYVGILYSAGSIHHVM